MKPRARLPRLVAGLALLALVPAHAAAPERAAQTRTRIEALIGRRAAPRPLPEALPNPFQTGSERAGLGPAQPGAPVGPGAPVEDDLSILARYATTLRISGAVEIGGRSQLVINGTPFKEGDLVKVPHTEPPEYLKLIGISRNELTLGLREAVLILPLRIN